MLLPEPCPLRYSGLMTQDDEKKLAAANSDELLARAYALETKDESLALYKDWADTYDEHMQQGLNYVSPDAIADVFAEFVQDKEVAILDIGCGTGLTGAAAATHGFHTVDGVDISPEMLAEAGKKGLYRSLILADLTGPLEIPSETYDAAISSGTFTHAHVGAGAFDEIFRILKPGALFACTINADIWVESGFDEKIKALADNGTMKVREIRSGAYFEGAEENGRFAVFEKC